MKKNFIVSVKFLALMTLLLGVAYPVTVTVLGQSLFAEKARGSLVSGEKGVTGSLLLAQKTASPRYFSYRPSASDYGTIPSGASNLGPTSRARADFRARAREQWGGGTEELLTTSGSGLDPHLSLESVQFQIPRIAKARGVEEAKLLRLAQTLVEPPDLGFLGAARINVMKLNQALDR